MELFPQSTQGGVFNGHETRRSTSLISTDEEETISQEVVIISDDASEDPTRTKEGGDRNNIRRYVSRRRWTLLEDCQLVEVIASHKQKFVWKTIAAGFPQRTSNSCRLRWIKMFKPEDTLFVENRWSEMAMLMGERVMNQWRLTIAQNVPDFYTSISPDHPLKRSCVQNVGPMININDPYVGGDKNGVGDTSMVLSRTSGRQPLVHPAIDLNLSLGNGHDQNSVAVAATTTTAQQPPLYKFL